MSLMQQNHPSDDEHGNAAKRRKVNTCLQCKSRKVKCDKVRPHCGPCQRRRIPSDECVFADEADPETLEHYLGPEYVASQGFDMMDEGAVKSNSALMALDNPQARAVLDRITREMRLREASSETAAIPTIASPTTMQTSAASGDSAVPIDPQLSEAFLTTSADTLMEDPKTASPAAPLDSGSQLPTIAKSTPETTKMILGLLPNDHVVNVLLDSLRTFESRSPLGMSWRLIRIQLINLRGDISDWRTGQVQEPEVDLSFLALLFELMVSAIDCKPIEEIISEGIALTGDQVPEMTNSWHSTCLTLLSMCKSDTEPNLNTVCTVFLFYLYNIRRGDTKSAVHHLQCASRGAMSISLQCLSSAPEDAARWRRDAEEDDTTIRTGAVTAMRKALFEGGESFTLGEERKVLQSLRHGRAVIQSRSVLWTNVPDRSHLVREAARTLWVSLTWHLDFFTPPIPMGEKVDTSNWTTALDSIDEAHLSDGETPNLPNGSSLASISTQFFRFLSTAAQFSIKYKQVIDTENVTSLLAVTVSEWNALADQHLAQMREQVGVGRAMLNHFSLLIHHWTRIRLLRTYFGQIEQDSALQTSKATLVTSCREALLQVQKITATSDVDLSIFQPLISLVKVDATLILALHLLANSSNQPYNSSDEWQQIRKAVTTSLLLIWTQASEDNPMRLSTRQSWRKPARQLIEHVLQEAFYRKGRFDVKIEDSETSNSAFDEEDRLPQSIGPLPEDQPLSVYQEELLADDPAFRYPLFFDALDGYFWSS